jgi:hypothetical protein
MNPFSEANSLIVSSDFRELGDFMIKTLFCTPKSIHWMSTSRSQSSSVNHTKYITRYVLETRLMKSRAFRQQRTRSRAVGVYLLHNGYVLQRSSVDGYLRAPADRIRLTSKSRLEQNNSSSRNNGVSTGKLLLTKPDQSFAVGHALDVSYVAEFHETLKHILVFVTVSGIPPDTELLAEVLPTSSSGTEGDWLVLRSSSSSSPPLSLPVRVLPGKKEVHKRQGHYELKIATANSRAARSFSPDEPTPLMSAEQLLSLKLTSLSCISCSLPLVHGSNLTKYRDLPSEHWEELVDAWMCHTDQALHNHVAKHSRGFWPEEGEALVGGGYILFHQAAIVSSNVSCVEQPLVGTRFLFILLVLSSGDQEDRRWVSTSGRQSTDAPAYFDVLETLAGFFALSGGSSVRREITASITFG